ncbi:MAG: hypothetical protein U1F77_17340 [Kiritimatiellia bacterium]
MSVFDLIGGQAARLLLRAGFMRQLVRPASAEKRAGVEADLGRRLLAGLMRDFPLSRDAGAWDALRRARDLLDPALRSRGLCLKPVALDLRGETGLALPGDHVVVSPAWVTARRESLKGLVFHLAALKSLSLLHDSFNRCGSMSAAAVPGSAEILRRLAGPPRATETVFQADRLAMDLCRAAGFGPDAALDALARPCADHTAGLVTPAARIQRLRAALPG